MTRRELLALAPIALAACAAPPSPAPPPPAGPALRVDPAVDLLPAAGLEWGVDARLRELLNEPALIPAMAVLVPEERFAAFARRHGGVDLRQVLELAVGAYPEATLAVARVPVDPARVEGAFMARALAVDGRAVEQGVTRTWGTVGESREQIAVFGRQGVAMERGRFGPLQAAEAFALGKLRRSRPALRAEPLAAAMALLGDAPLRAFAPGPFEGEWGRGLGGLLGAATAAVCAARVAPGARPGVAMTLLLTGAWGSDAPAAAERLRAAFDLLGSGPLGRLLALDRPLAPLRPSGDASALRLEATFDALALARGLHAVTEARVADVLEL